MKKSLLLLVPALFLIASCGDKKEENPEPPTHEHIFTDELKFDANSHFFACDCGERINVEDHVDLNGDHSCDVCGFKIPIPPCPEGQHVNLNEDVDMLCDICGYPIEYKHAKSVKGEPNAPFILKVDEEKEIKAVLDPTPQRAVEKTFTWKSSNETIATVEADPTNTAKAKIKGLKPGKVKFTATNDYSPNILFHEFEATVVQFDEENMNLWEYKSDDKSQFGYTSDLKQGVASGTAVLNGLSWEFTRSEAISLNLSKGGMLGFGKGEDPETLVKLVNHNIRKVKSISIETCSANGLANLTVKVGDVTVIEGSTPASNKDYIPPMNSGNLDNLSGDISIQFDTPAMDPSRVEDETYKKPGSVYLKSIWITYAPEEIDYKSIKTYDFATMYADTESDFYKSLKSTAGPQIFEDDDFVISFAKIGKGDGGLVNFAKTNSDIEIKIKKTDEVIKNVTFEYQSGSTANQYSVFSSILGGAPYENTYGLGSDSRVSAIISDSYVNAVSLSPNKTNYVGVKTITIKTVEGEHAVIDSVAFAESAVPDKLEYNDGDLFDPTGLGDATVKFVNSEIPDAKIATSAFEYFDGPSYDEPTDHSGKKTSLSEGTTYVYAVYKNFEIKIEGLTVNLSLITLNKVKEIADLTDGTYLITSPSKKAILKGSADSSSNFGASKYIDYIDSCEFGDQITLNYSYESELVTFASASDVFHLSTLSGKNIGMTGSHGVSVAKSPAFPDWNISIDESGNVTMSIIDTANENTPYYYGYGTTTFKFSTTNPANIALYKIAD